LQMNADSIEVVSDASLANARAILPVGRSALLHFEMTISENVKLFFTKVKINGGFIMTERPSLTDRQIQILRMLYQASESTSVFTVKKTQGDLARELALTRQALNIHLRRLREEGLIRTGRGFIDLTEGALVVLGIGTAEAFVFLKIQPFKRDQVYDKVRRLNATRVFRVTGEIDLIAQVPQSRLDTFLENVSNIDGVVSTSSHVVISIIK